MPIYSRDLMHNSNDNIFKSLYETEEEMKNRELRLKVETLEKRLIKEMAKIKELEKEKTHVELPERYIINEDATILFWKDGKKTIVKRCKGDEFNPRLAFLTAFFQYYCGMSKNKANKYLNGLKIEELKINKKTMKNIELKVGDKVVVRNDLKINHCYGTDVFIDEMEDLKGKEVTILKVKEVEGCTEYRIEEDGYKYFWTKEMFEKKKPKHMKEDE